MRTAREMRQLLEDYERSVEDEVKVRKMLVYLDDQCSQRAKNGLSNYVLTELVYEDYKFPLELLTSRLSKLGYEVSVRISQFTFTATIKW